MWDVIDEELGKKEGKAKGEVRDYYVKQLTTLGRVSEPEDVAKLASFLAGSDSDFVTGKNLLGRSLLVSETLADRCACRHLGQNMLVDGGICFS